MLDPLASEVRGGAEILPKGAWLSSKLGREGLVNEFNVGFGFLDSVLVERVFIEEKVAVGPLGLCVLLAQFHQERPLLNASRIIRAMIVPDVGLVSLWFLHNTSIVEI